jgi:addiction module RelE/StbE family toxin
LARLIYARRAFADLDRLARFVEDQGEQAIQVVIDRISEAVEVLERHPEIGRLAEHGLRELVISRGKTGYIALYDFYVEDDLVVILAVRAQREAGYA